MPRTPRLLCLMLLWLGLAPAITVGAHNLELTDTLVIFKADGTYQIDMIVDLDALALGASPQTDSAVLAAELASLSPEDLETRLADLRRLFHRRVRVRFDGAPVTSAVSFPAHGTAMSRDAEVPTFLGLTARLEGRIPADATSFSFRASRAFPPVHLTVLDHGHPTLRQLVERGTPSAPLVLGPDGVEAEPSAASRRDVVGRYLVLGFWHIVPEGLDHILFVLGLFLLAARLRPLLWQVSAFTVAHTITLAISSYGVFDLPSRLVEPLIALSIAYVAIENLFTEELKPWRPAMVFAFGLLHGLGFAGVLGELGLPRGEFTAALLSFNAGVEFGQLVVLLAAFAVFGWWRERPWYHRRIVVPASLLIAAFGLYWAVERSGLVG